jgi:Tyrosyl-DNA phosphodiesterase
MSMFYTLLYTDNGRNMTNAVFVTERLPLKSEESTPTEFERSLCDYFAAYSPSRTGQLVSRLKRYDFASVKARFVASIPGKFEGASIGKWGIGRLQKLLKQIETHRNSEIFAQVYTTPA